MSSRVRQVSDRLYPGPMAKWLAAFAAGACGRKWPIVVEKVARSVGIVLLGRFDLAELSRLLGFEAAGLAATSTRTRLT